MTDRPRWRLKHISDVVTVLRKSQHLIKLFDIQRQTRRIHHSVPIILSRAKASLLGSYLTTSCSPRAEFYTVLEEGSPCLQGGFVPLSVDVLLGTGASHGDAIDANVNIMAKHGTNPR
jgi:hypothetical protein